MIAQHAKRIVAEWYGAFQRNEIEPLLALFHDDAYFHDPRLPPMRGQKAIRSYYEDLFSKTTNWDGVIEGPYFLGAPAFNVRCRFTFEHRPTHRRGVLPMSVYFALDTDGRIHRYEEFYDTAALFRSLEMPAPAQIISQA